jgi:hypothetical protein
MPNFDFRNSEIHAPIKELWERVETLAAHIENDNTLTEEKHAIYPLEVRELQTNSLKELIKIIEKTHEKMRKEEDN